MSSISSILSNPFLSLVIFIASLIILLVSLKNEQITNFEIEDSPITRISLYDVEIKVWKDYKSINFTAKAEKLRTILFSNYLYCNNVQIHKMHRDTLINIQIPILEIYTNLYFGKAENVKSVLYLNKQKLILYSQKLEILNQRIKLTRNYVYHIRNDTTIKAFYPKMEIYLQ
ncbi:MAG: hypothetical protein ABDH21_04680 [bacterium]